jgi:hypothetical protein
MPQRLLDPGDARIGWLLDGDDSTPDVATMLRRTDNRLVLTLPWREHDSPYERWFGRHIIWSDDPDKSKFTYDPPEMLWFVGADGPIGLVDCRSLGHRMTSPGTSEGRLAIGMAVLGATPGQDYRLVNGMQSVTPGIGLWLGQRSLERSPVYDDESRLSGLNLEWSRESPIRISRRLNLFIRSGFEFRDVVPGDQAILEDQFYMETLVSRARPWRDHLELHVALQDLVALADWQALDFAGLVVTRDADPARTMDGKSHGRQWLQAQISGLPQRRSSPRKPRYLFGFEDLGSRGVARWFDLRLKLPRVTQPIVLSLRQEYVPLQAQLLQVGAAVEALGFHLAFKDTRSKRKASEEPFKEQADRVVADLGGAFVPVTDAWSQQLRVAYRGAKHADRTLPQPEDTIHLLRTTRLILRLWIARRLGVPEERLRRNARVDPMGSHLSW